MSDMVASEKHFKKKMMQHPYTFGPSEILENLGEKVHRHRINNNPNKK